MKGYKFLERDLRAPFQKDFVYELDKWYELEDESRLKIGDYGFHFYKTIRDIFDTVMRYNMYDIYEIDASGKIEEDKFNGCSSKIKIVKKLEKEDIWKLIEEGDLIHDESLFVRLAVAVQGYGLDTLVNDSSPLVRTTVAEQCYGLDKLIDDESPYIRATVAEQGYGLDILINDQHWAPRASVASQGYGLDKLISDPERAVRMAVAEQGYGLDILINDEDQYVRKSAHLQMCRLKNRAMYTDK